MLDLFKDLRDLLKIKKYSIDNSIFKLHYKVTFTLLLSFSIILGAKTFIGDPIHCFSDVYDKSVPHEVLEAFCWIHSTYTVTEERMNKSIVGVHVPHPGVSQLKSVTDRVRYHKYYQWVSFVLVFQAGLFYIPRYLWKLWEGGRLKMLYVDINDATIDETSRIASKKLIEDYFLFHLNERNMYAFKYIVCEFLNLVNVVGQGFFMDMFLDYEFSKYGWMIATISEADPYTRDDVMSRVFPKVTKCTFNKYGPSGNIVPYDALCVLPLNVVNEKIFVILWFWLIILTALSILNFMYRFITFSVPLFRRMLLKSRCPFAASARIHLIERRLQVGDWFLLYQLGKNIDSIFFKQILDGIYVRLEATRSV